VTPTLATRYQVKLFARKSATTPLATSPRQNLYVLTNGYYTGARPAAARRAVKHSTSTRSCPARPLVWR
jgi:hypothetical protein